MSGCRHHLSVRSVRADNFARPSEKTPVPEVSIAMGEVSCQNPIKARWVPTF